MEIVRIKLLLLSLILFSLSIPACSATKSRNSSDSKKVTNVLCRTKFTLLKQEVTKPRGTEQALPGKYFDNLEKGVYRHSNFGARLFVSSTEFEIGTGWPSFDRAIKAKNLRIAEDHYLGMKGDKTACSNCGTRSCHLFDDGQDSTNIHRVTFGRIIPVTVMLGRSGYLKPSSNSVCQSRIKYRDHKIQRSQVIFQKLVKTSFCHKFNNFAWMLI